MHRAFGVLSVLFGLIAVSCGWSYYCVFKMETYGPSGCSGGVGSDCYTDTAQVFDHCQLTVSSDCIDYDAPVLALRQHFLCQAGPLGVRCDTSAAPQWTEYVTLTLRSCRSEMTRSQ